MQFIHIGPGGTTMMSGGGPGNLPCQPGEEFTEYVRSKLKPFPPCSPYQCGNSLERTTLWPGRRAEFKLGERVQTAKVVKWTEWTTGFMCPCTMWNLTMDVGDGRQVEMQVVQAKVGKGGQVLLTGGSKYSLPNELKLVWLDPPTEPVEESSDEEEEEEEEEEE